MMRNCSEIERFVDLYLDAEFGDEDKAKFEAHLEGCDACRKQVEAQVTWRRRIVEASPKIAAPANLRNFITAGMDEAERAQRRTTNRRRALAAAMLPAAAAAAYALVLMRPAAPHRPTLALPVVADVVQKHARNMPIEVSTSKEDDVRKWYSDKVDFPVRPPKFKNVSGQAMLRGGRLANVRDRDAAYLVYDVNGNKVSVFMFDPREMQGQEMPRETAGNHQVTFGADRGYNVALFEDSGVGYAIASDMDRESMVKLISAVGH